MCESRLTRGGALTVGLSKNVVSREPRSEAASLPGTQMREERGIRSSQEHNGAKGQAAVNEWVLHEKRKVGAVAGGNG